MDAIQQFMDSFLSTPGIVRLLLGILLAGLSCSIVSPFVIVKRLTLASVGIGCSAMASALIGMLSFPMMTLADWRIQVASAGGAFIFAVLILLFNRNSVIPKESFLGVLIVGAFGLSLFATLEWGYPVPDLTHYLYAAPHVSSPIDLSILGGLAAFSTCFVWVFHRRLFAICIDRAYATAVGICTGFYDFLFMVLLTATILLSIYCVGLLLTVTLLILPGLCARLLTLRLGRMVFISLASGLVSCLASVVGSHWLIELPISISLALIQFVLFILLFGIDKIRARWTYRIQ